MKKIIMLTMLFAVSALSALSVPSYSTTVGVTEDDYFTYVPTYNETISGSGFAIPYQLANFTYMSEVDSINRTVTDVTGTVVTFQEDWVFNNGSDPATLTLVVDITNTTALDALSIPLIDADATLGDQVAYDGSWNSEGMFITGTFEWGFPEETRDCNVHISMTTAYATVNRTFCWDEATGILVQHWVTISYASGDGGAYGDFRLTLTETNLWEVPEFPTGTALLLVFVAVTVSIDIYRRKKLKF